MTEQIAALLERYLGLTNAQARTVMHISGSVGAAVLFVLLATAIVSGGTLFANAADPASLTVGAILSDNILAPTTITYESAVLTERSRQEAADNVGVVYDPPDPNVSRTQSQLARQVLDFIRNVRNDPYGTVEQKRQDLQQITALTLNDSLIETMLGLSADAWQAVDDEIINVLERVMRESIRDNDLPVVRNQLPTQVSIRFSTRESSIIVAIVEDLIRPNTFPNDDSTASARQAAMESVAPVPRSFTVNEVVVRANEPITPEDYEALSELGLLRSEARRTRDVAQAFLASILVTVITGLYISRFERSLYENTRFMLLLVVIFLLVLAGARFVGATGQIYLYPTAMLALLFVSLARVRVAVVGSLNLALLIGLMLGGSMEITTLVVAGSVTGILTLRSTERLNNYFVSGLIIGLVNIVVVTIFNLSSAGATAINAQQLGLLVVFSLINGVFAAAATIAAMYLVTLLVNLPTSLKLAELSQPNNPLLQRLLREAPGTYQHSLQVANLSEQAALAVGANAELVRVAALYHDVGKMLNPIFFSENQQFGGGNPHDALDDPYRSADIIVRHVTDGLDLARQYRLPLRIRDFIMEHHGTTEVYVFYQRAVSAAGGDESAVDIDEFRYPGPRPRSRETGIMMIADSCESAVRSIGPTSKQHVSEIVQDIIDGKMRGGQLDESGLTLNDLKAIHNSMIEMLQAVYHPRIDYKRATTTQQRDVTPATRPRSTPVANQKEASSETPKVVDEAVRAAKKNEELPAVNVEDDDLALLSDDDTPMSDVPALPRSNEVRSNGKAQKPTTEDKETEDEQRD